MITCDNKNFSHVAGSEYVFEYVNYEVMLGAQIYIVLSILTFHTNFIRWYKMLWEALYCNEKSLYG